MISSITGVNANPLIRLATAERSALRLAPLTRMAPETCLFLFPAVLAASAAKATPFVNRPTS